MLLTICQVRDESGLDHGGIGRGGGVKTLSFWIYFEGKINRV